MDIIAQLGSTGSSYNVFSIVAIIVGISGVAGVVFAVFRSNLATQTIALLKENNEALQDRVEALEQQGRAKDTLIKEQGEQLKALQDMVTGSTAIVQLADQVKVNHLEILDHLKVLEAAIK